MRLTTLKLRSLKPCESTTRMLNSLPDRQGFGERMFQFDVKIPTKLWKHILRRRDFICATHLTLGQARNKYDIDIRTCEDENTLSSLDSGSPVRSLLHNAVYVTPVDTELFDRFDIRVLRSVVLFRGPNIINFNVILHGIIAEAIFDVSSFPDVITDRPSGVLVSYNINV